MKNTKSIVMKSAWSMFKMLNYSFSECLELAWKDFKNGVKAVIVKSNKLIKSIGLGYETVYFNELVFTNIETLKTVCDNQGAKHDYGIGIFNND